MEKQKLPVPQTSLALNLIRPSWKTRMQDRTWLGALLVVAITLYLFREKAIDGPTALAAVTAALGFWGAGNQYKDASIGSAAVKATPETVNAGTANIGATPLVDETPTLETGDEAPLFP